MNRFARLLSSSMMRPSKRPGNLAAGRRVLLAVIVVSLGVGACAPGQTVNNATRLVVEGRLRGQFVNSFPCVWIVESSGDLVYIMLPPGWDQAADPIRVIDSDGVVIAEAGDKVRGESFEGSMFGGDTICAPGEVPIQLETLVKL
jgi:hypothetical protein